MEEWNKAKQQEVRAVITSHANKYEKLQLETKSIKNTLNRCEKKLEELGIDPGTFIPAFHVLTTCPFKHIRVFTGLRVPKERGGTAKGNRGTKERRRGDPASGQPPDRTSARIGGIR